MHECQGDKLSTSQLLSLRPADPIQLQNLLHVMVTINPLSNFLHVLDRRPGGGDDHY